MESRHIASKETLALCYSSTSRIYKTVKFSVEELLKYLRRMSITDLQIKVIARDSYDGVEKGCIWIGLYDELGIQCLSDNYSDFDDEITIDIENGNGLIAGVNSRSILLAVYRFLNEIGCHWVRPGPDGEYVPEEDILKTHCKLQESPSYRHRAITIEGAVSIENVIDMIDWAPKIGFSGYFVQFREGYTFFERWYSHQNNSTKVPEEFTQQMAREFVIRIEREIHKRGLLYHSVGHGWTCEALGIPGLGWDPVKKDWPPEISQYLAEVNGVRAMWYDIPMITSLCFSNPKVRELVVNCIADYIAAHPNIDLLHFWLDDGFNNVCECENCRKRLPADFYVQMLNELDDLLTHKGFTTKIVFLVYLNLLWAPQVERIKNPDRFVLMFAPISRSYRKPLEVDDLSLVPPPYVRNRLELPSSPDENLAFLRQWKTIFPGDSFIFEYHFMNPGIYVCDPDGMFMAGLVAQEVKNLKQLKLNGLVSCQLQRVFFPTGLGMTVLGRKLWNDRFDFNALSIDYFTAAFGEDGIRARMYLESLSELQDLVHLRGRELTITPLICKDALATIEAFVPIIDKNLSLAERCHAQSWFYLKVQSRIMHLFLNMLSARYEGQIGEANEKWAELMCFVQENEDAIQSVFDVYAFIDRYDKRLDSQEWKASYGSIAPESY